jgi:ketosteroid isomerase-like protein
MTTDDETGAEDQVEAATEAIRRDLDAQRIAWIYADPLTALHAEAKPECGYARLAR